MDLEMRRSLQQPPTLAKEKYNRVAMDMEMRRSLQLNLEKNYIEQYMVLLQWTWRCEGHCNPKDDRKTAWFAAFFAFIILRTLKKKGEMMQFAESEQILNTEAGSGAKLSLR